MMRGGTGFFYHARYLGDLETYDVDTRSALLMKLSLMGSIDGQFDNLTMDMNVSD
jgi:hypothetical protein